MLQRESDQLYVAPSARQTNPDDAPSPRRSLILCADDYALAPGVSTAIRTLVEAGRLSATSCMTASPFWPEHAAWLRPLRERADIGLHLTLTDQTPLGPMPGLAPQGRFPSMGKLMLLAFRGRLDRREIAAEIERQIDAFEAEMGGPPAFLDGHQHVHQLPLVRDAVFGLFRQRFRKPGAWLRVTAEPVSNILSRRVAPVRALVIATIAAGMRRRARRLGIPHNNGFRGVYDFSGRVPYDVLFRRFLSGGGARPLVMCHPGLVDDALRAADPLTDQRETEYHFFMSAAFPETLEDAGFVLARLSDAASAG